MIQRQSLGRKKTEKETEGKKHKRNLYNILFFRFYQHLKNIWKAGKVCLWLNGKTVFLFCKESRRVIMARSNSGKRTRKASPWEWQKKIRKLELNRQVSLGVTIASGWAPIALNFHRSLNPYPHQNKPTHIL